MPNRKHGFTLIELVIVVAILGILASIAIPRFLDAQATARGSKIVADMRTLESAFSLYLMDNSVSLGEHDAAILVTGTKKYMAAIPAVPAGTAKFPNGQELDLPSTATYKLYKHSSFTDVALAWDGYDWPLSYLTK